MEIALVAVCVWVIYDAIKGYNAERHAKKAVHGQDISFIEYMCSRHPVMTVCGTILIMLTIIAIIRSIF